MPHIVFTPIEKTTPLQDRNRRLFIATGNHRISAGPFFVAQMRKHPLFPAITRVWRRGLCDGYASAGVAGLYFEEVCRYVLPMHEGVTVCKPDMPFPYAMFIIFHIAYAAQVENEGLYG